MIKLRSKRLTRTLSKLGGSGNKSPPPPSPSPPPQNNIKWELRPGGMLVQKRDTSQDEPEGIITVRVSTVPHCHHISIQSTSTFGELKMILSLVTSLEPREQRILFRGKERDDEEYLHMVGVRDNDKVLLLEDPAIKEKKMLLSLVGSQPITPPCPPTISV
ncbi:BAG family molecular chaperone regulator 2-like [Senna tora]|uniref:BAG family molecular chaperone regulator 2-like n=1 Tax=Senna tora TaxID=362788 RepID=A0A834WJT8_9FABA|nr:BAG family molecular chaperone regulator 2-like [Senna tora]